MANVQEAIGLVEQHHWMDWTGFTGHFEGIRQGDPPTTEKNGLQWRNIIPATKINPRIEED